MRSIVTRYRPEIRENLRKNPVMIDLIEIVVEGWDKDPESRLMATTMVKRLKNLMNKNGFSSS